MDARTVYEINREQALRCLGENLPPWNELTYAEREHWENVAYEINVPVEQAYKDGFNSGFLQGESKVRD